MSSIAFPPDDASGSTATRLTTTDDGPRTTDRATRNRQNARKSTGPRTPAGKARSAQNARTHGLTASTPPTDHPVPDPTANLAFTTLLQELKDEHHPATATQITLVEELALVIWKLQYLPRIEHRLLNTPLDPTAHPPTPQPNPQHLTPHPRLDSPVDHPQDPTAAVYAQHLAQDRPTPLTRVEQLHHRLQARLTSLCNQLRRLRKDQQQRHDDDNGNHAAAAQRYNRAHKQDHDALSEEVEGMRARLRQREEDARRERQRDDAPTPSAPSPARDETRDPQPTVTRAGEGRGEGLPAPQTPTAPPAETPQHPLAVSQQPHLPDHTIAPAQNEPTQNLLPTQASNPPCVKPSPPPSCSPSVPSPSPPPPNWQGINPPNPPPTPMRPSP